MIILLLDKKVDNENNEMLEKNTKGEIKRFQSDFNIVFRIRKNKTNNLNNRDRGKINFGVQHFE